jgi:hypothetical protein
LIQRKNRNINIKRDKFFSRILKIREKHERKSVMTDRKIKKEMKTKNDKRATEI